MEVALKTVKIKIKKCRYFKSSEITNGRCRIKKMVYSKLRKNQSKISKLN